MLLQQGMVLCSSFGVGCEQLVLYSPTYTQQSWAACTIYSKYYSKYYTKYYSKRREMQKLGKRSH